MHGGKSVEPRITDVYLDARERERKRGRGGGEGVRI